MYDVYCFNETSYEVSKLPHGVDGIMLKGFNPPITQPPVRASDKGSGLAIYINKNICDEDDYDQIGPDKNGEFLFVKINNCTKTEKSVVLGNVYRSPLNNKQKFLDFCTEAFCKK